MESSEMHAIMDSAVGHLQAGRLDEAESLYRTALEALTRTGREESDRAQSIRQILAGVLNDKGKLKQVEESERANDLSRYP
ncbi:MAG: hypothetical protein IID42_13020 [Planctomycetes bacterium]|nr:hypothetical protein [Planctomycetota bacterium]